MESIRMIYIALNIILMCWFCCELINNEIKSGNSDWYTYVITHPDFGHETTAELSLCMYVQNGDLTNLPLGKLLEKQYSPDFDF